MYFLLGLMVTSFCFTHRGEAILKEQSALQDCSNLHHLEFVNIPNAKGYYSNSNCMLKCTVGETTLSSNAINEAFPCPADANGICHKGECVQQNKEAVRQCGNLLHIDFLDAANHGTAYMNNGCAIKCVIGGNVVLNQSINEGFHCLTEPNGICKSGQCDLTHSPSGPVTTDVTTPTTPTTTVKPSIFKTHKIDEIRVTVYSAKLPQAYTNLSTTVCLEGARPPGNMQSSICRKTCQTGQVAKQTDHPEWNLTSENPCVISHETYNEEDGFRINVNQFNSMKNSIGDVNLNILTMANYYYQLEEHHDPSRVLVIKRNYNLYRGSSPIGDMDLMFEVKFASK